MKLSQKQDKQNRTTFLAAARFLFWVQGLCSSHTVDFEEINLYLKITFSIDKKPYMIEVLKIL